MTNEKLVRIKNRIDTAANWETNNPILAKGEIGIDEDVNKIKIGDGLSNWNDLEYSTNNISDSSSTGGINQIFDSGDTFDFTDKNANATALDSTLTGNINKGATGNYASSFGGKSAAMGKRSHAEGTTTIAKGNYSHAEGDNSVALGDDSHAEGYSTVAKGNASHSEGENTVASGLNSHAEGNSTIASGDYSHAEGNSTKSTNANSHAEGDNTIAAAANQHVQGKWNKEDSGKYAHIVGNGSDNLSRSNAHTLDWSGNAWYQGNIKIGGTSYDDKNAIDIRETINNLIGKRGIGQSAEIFNDYRNKANGKYTHAEGSLTEANSICSHAEGYKCIASGDQSHAEGESTKALGNISHTEGDTTISNEIGSHAEGYHTLASSKFQHVQGKCNIEDTNNKYAHIVGNGDYYPNQSSVYKRSNAHTLDWNGNSWYAGNIKIGGSSYDDTNAKEIATKEYVDSNTGNNKYPINIPYKQLVTAGAKSETTAKTIGNVSTASAYLISLCGDLGSSSVPTFNIYIDGGSTYSKIQLDSDYSIYINISSNGNVNAYCSTGGKNNYNSYYIIIVEPLTESMQSVTIS